MHEKVSRRRMVAAIGSASMLVSGCTARGASPLVNAATDEELFVSPEGSDFNPGTAAAPLEHIETALDIATPGTTIRLRPGEYRESVHTKTDGEPDAPITITGPPEAVIRAPPGNHDCVYVNHHHTHITGITIDGLLEPAKELQDHNAYADNAVWITPKDRAMEGVEFLRGVVCEPSRVGNSAKALIQTSNVRDISIGNFTVIGPPGVRYDDRVDNTEEGHVGEIVYVGQPETERNSFKYRYPRLDRTSNVRIHHIDNSAGYRHAEFADIKLGCTDVVVEYCTSRNSSHSSENSTWPMINLAGNNCTIRWNDFADGSVAFNISAWVPSGDIDGTEWGRNNSIYGNRLSNFSKEVFRARTGGDIVSVGLDGQEVICGNTIEDSAGENYDSGTSSCPTTLPTSETIGHLGGDSPHSE